MQMVKTKELIAAIDAVANAFDLLSENTCDFAKIDRWNTATEAAQRATALIHEFEHSINGLERSDLLEVQARTRNLAEKLPHVACILELEQARTIRFSKPLALLFDLPNREHLELATADLKKDAAAMRQANRPIFVIKGVFYWHLAGTFLSVAWDACRRIAPLSFPKPRTDINAPRERSQS